jgi:hypothetical protein
MRMSTYRYALLGWLLTRLVRRRLAHRRLR